MAADIAFRERTQNRVHDGMEGNVRIAMPGEPVGMRDLHSVQPKRFARFEPMNIETEACPRDEVRGGGEAAFQSLMVARQCDLLQNGVSFHHDDRPSCGSDHLGIIGRFVDPLPVHVRLHQATEAKALRCLHPPQRRAVDDISGLFAVLAHESIDHGQHRNGPVIALCERTHDPLYND